MPARSWCWIFGRRGAVPVAAKYNVNAYPTTIVIDRNGRIAGYLVGGRDEADLRASIGTATKR
ncbi:MAG TPA: hypothetical protein VG456_08810 [Candidatus Sulfopaludibacter sp.]|jgi:hypothetical protein|nr:hypothetical protein [Candidatus Sulfopaludibacter sp.]